MFSLSFVRNECAHGGVLYGRELEIQPRAHRLFPQVSNRRAFYQVLVLSWLLECDIPNSSQMLIDDFAKLLSCGSLRRGLAAPKDWIDDVRNVPTMAGLHSKGDTIRTNDELEVCLQYP